MSITRSLSSTAAKLQSAAFLPTLGTLLGLLFGAVIASTDTPRFRAHTILQIHSQLKETENSALIGGLSNTVQKQRSAEALATLQSDAVLRELIRRNARLFAPFQPMTPGDLAHLTKLGAAVNESTGLINVTAEWSNPATARHLSDELINIADNLMRQRALDTSSAAIRRFERVAAREQAIFQRKLSAALIETHLKSNIIAGQASPYQLHVIEPATTATEPVTPSIWLDLLFGALSGFFITTIVSSLYAAGSKKDQIQT